MDDYENIRSSKTYDKEYYLEIYFKRKDLKFLIERWKFQYKQ
jgi:hypothetical protein